MLSQWILSSDRPLAHWILDEPRGSQLVVMTRTPRRSSRVSARPTSYVEGLPIKGKLGFSVKIDTGNKLVVDKIDPTRLAFANGLQEGDVIRDVDGQRVRTQKDLVEKILAGLDEGGATLTIVRNDLSQTLVLQPMVLYDEGYPGYWDEFDDSLPTPPDSTAIPDSTYDAPY